MRRRPSRFLPSPPSTSCRIITFALGMGVLVVSARRTLHNPAILSLCTIRLAPVPIGRLQVFHIHGAPHRCRRAMTQPQRRPYHLRPLNHENSTIYALSTASGKAAIAVIRISGPACIQVSVDLHSYSSAKG
jgi:tRNA modification GTPase